MSPAEVDGQNISASLGRKGLGSLPRLEERTVVSAGLEEPASKMYASVR